MAQSLIAEFGAHSLSLFQAPNRAVRLVVSTSWRRQSIRLPLSQVPVDFLADPDGDWNYESLVTEAGLDPDVDDVAIGALTCSFAGFSAGAAVIVASAKPESIVLLACRHG